MNVEATLKVPGRVYNVALGATPPPSARFWIEEPDILFCDGREVGKAVVESVDAEPIYEGYRESPVSWIVHETTLAAILKL